VEEGLSQGDWRSAEIAVEAVNRENEFNLRVLSWMCLSYDGDDLQVAKVEVSVA